MLDVMVDAGLLGCTVSGRHSLVFFRGRLFLDALAVPSPCALVLITYLCLV